MTTCPPGFHVEEICVADPAPVPVWTDLGVVPAIAASPTAQGKVICQLQPHNGKLYLGYGDWTATAQPGCDLIAWDVTASAFITITHIPTDALWSNRVVNNELWAITTDPEIGADPDVTIVRNDGSLRIVSGATELTPYPWHSFDAVWFNGREYLAGADRSKGESISYATVWIHEPRPLPRTDWYWRPVYQRTNSTTGRMYGLFVHNGQLHAAGSNGKIVRSPDGITWTELPFAVPAVLTKPMNRGSSVYYRQDWPGVAEGWLYEFVGYAQNALAIVRDHYVDGADLWTLSGRDVKKNNALVRNDAPIGARSIAAAWGKIYIGTADSHLWSFG